MKEQIFLSEQRIKVTNARLMIKDETYSMAGIISVKSGVLSSSENEKGFTLKEKFQSIILCTLFFGVVSKVLFTLNNWLCSFMGLASIAIMILAIWVIAVGKISKDVPPTYVISLRTASGELRALENQDRDFVGRVTRALNDAIVARG